MSTKPFLQEYRSVRPEDLSQRTLIAESGEWKLQHHTAGYEPAGSVARYTKERWSVTVYDRNFNATHGRSFRALSDADAYFHERIAGSN